MATTSGPSPTEPGPRVWRQPLTLTVVLLSLTTGVTDATSFLHLGGAFSSVITGNLVVLSASAITANEATLIRVVVAVCLYGLGVFAGARVGLLRRYSTERDERWRPRTAGELIAIEAVLLALLWVGWRTAHGSSSPAVEIPLIALAGLAMGLQSVAVLALGRAGLSTTYLTGALTQLVSSAARPGWRRRFDSTQALALAGVLAGACLAAVLSLHVSWAGPLPAVLFAGAASAVVLRKAAQGGAPWS